MLKLFDCIKTIFLLKQMIAYADVYNKRTLKMLAI